MRILILNGPNLNLLGVRAPDIYGCETYENLIETVKKKAKELNIEVDFFQSNHEGALIDRIHEARKNENGIVFNPGAYTHTSIALMDAIESVLLPCIEVHISNVHKREDFRQISYTAKASIGSIVGLGIKGYELALEALVELI